VAIKPKFREIRPRRKKKFKSISINETN